MHGSIKLNLCGEEVDVKVSDSLIEEETSMFFVGGISFALCLTRVALPDLNIMNG